MTQPTGTDGPSEPSFLERARSQQARKGPTCTMGAALAEMPDAYRESVLEALRTPTVNGATIYALLRADGYVVNNHAVLRHRRKLVGGAGEPCGCAV